MSEVWAPAKLTTELIVTGRRDDGYHLLDAEMVAVSLADVLEIEEGPSELVVEGAPGARPEAIGPVEQNLVTRALQAAGRQAAVVVHKAIPIGGGLGGGSADAAAVLRWAGIEDLNLAASLGGDVPFCLIGGRARVGGIGEVVVAQPFVAATYVLVVPSFGISTPAVFAAYDRLGPGSPPAPHRNDLFDAALEVEPRLEEVVGALRGATGREPSLAGSGSTLFYEATRAELGIGTTLAVAEVRCQIIEVEAVPRNWTGPPR